MSAWAVGFYTPAYMFLYSSLDRAFPRKTPLTVSARVLGSLVYSVPVNAAFFLYGTAVHHALEWYDLWEEREEDGREERIWEEEEEEEEEERENLAAAEYYPEGAEGADRRRRERERLRRALFLPRAPGGTSSSPNDDGDECSTRWRSEERRVLH